MHRRAQLVFCAAALVVSGFGAGCGGTDGGSQPTTSDDMPRPDVAAGKGDHLDDLVEGELKYGDAVTGSFDHDITFKGYRFEGQPGGVVSVDNTNLGTSRNLDSTLFLYARRDSSWERIAFDDDSGWGEHAAIRDFELPESSGTYLAVLGTAEARDRGDFRLELTCENDQCRNNSTFQQASVSTDLQDATRRLSDDGIFHRSGIEAYTYQGSAPAIDSLTDAMIRKQREPEEWTREEPLADLDELARQLDAGAYPSRLRADLGDDSAQAEIGYARNPEPGRYDAAYSLYVVHFPNANKVYNVEVLYVD